MPHIKIERRKHPRYDFCHMIEYSLETETTRKIFMGEIVNISKSGICLHVLNFLPNGQEIKIKRKPSYTYQTATVRWIDKIRDNFYRVGLLL
jgi:hypothetical protein